MPDAAPVTSAVLPDRSPIRDRGSPHGSGRGSAWPPQCRSRLPSARLLAEQHPALHLVLLLGLDDRHHHGAGLALVVLHHRVGDVLHQSALLIERAPAERIDDDFWHVSLPALRNTAQYGTARTIVQARHGRSVSLLDVPP